MGDPYEQCPVPECPRRKHKRFLMCRAHWTQVPKPVRDKIYRVVEEYRAEPDQKKRNRISWHWYRLTSEAVRKLGELSNGTVRENKAPRQ